jgi:hypothetical protein
MPQINYSLLRDLLWGPITNKTLERLTSRSVGIAADIIRVVVKKTENENWKSLSSLINSSYLTEFLKDAMTSSIAPLSGVENPTELVDPINRYSMGSAMGQTIVSFPEWVMPLGFDEVRYSTKPIIDLTLSGDAKGIFEEHQISIKEMLTETKMPEGIIRLLLMCNEVILKSTQFRSLDGVWHDYEGVLDHIVPIEANLGFSGYLSGMRENWIRELIDSNNKVTRVVTLPKLQLPSNPHEDTQLHIVTRSILEEVASEKQPLESVHWRVLEEIVGELLRGMGLEVVITPRSRDGGRDVVARGELIPGEPTLFAVEVKHKPVVTISDLRNALWANRQFPALLFATSGRFSAGIYRERRQNETMLRLFLKDGVALKQWINEYVKSISDEVSRNI